MKELISKLNLQDRHVLTKQLIRAGYAFAAWQMPLQNEITFIVSLKGAFQLGDFLLTDLDQGFLINRYSDNHPLKPYYIGADLVIKSDDILLNPKITSGEIDAFKSKMDNHENVEKKQVRSKIQEQSPSDFERNVSRAVEEIRNGSFEKVVLSRYKDEELPDDFSPWKFFEGICEKYNNSFSSITYIPDQGLWIGATPELLISDDSQHFRTVSLAGTKHLTENQTLSEIAWTQKEIEEQAFVSRYVINCFKKIRLREFHEHGPKTIQAGNLAHLKTEFIVDYAEVSFDGLADQMLELLHPTSAVCGMPIEQTKPWISQVENYDREFYSGFLGPVNLENKIDLFVNLRCMKVSNGIVRFYAGAGITEDSSPQKEYEETEMKMNILKGLI